jgi:hypothetical protein
MTAIVFSLFGFTVIFDAFANPEQQVVGLPVGLAMLGFGLGIYWLSKIRHH